jgi:hypothetical protein
VTVSSASTSLPTLDRPAATEALVAVPSSTLVQFDTTQALSEPVSTLIQSDTTEGSVSGTILVPTARPIVTIREAAVQSGDFSALPLTSEVVNPSLTSEGSILLTLLVSHVNNNRISRFY